MTNMRCIRPSAMALGEGPVWSVADQALHYVDIKQGHVHRLHSPSGSHGTHDVGGMPSFIVPTADSGHIVGSGSGLHHLHDGTLSKAFVTIPQPDHNRTNDATVAPDGRLWFGTMDNNERQPTGRLWCLDRGTLRSTEIGAIVTNGPAFSRDGQWLYHVDSVERTIWRHEMRANGMPGPGERFVQLHPDEGHPDGIVIDAQDCLWVALWDGWGIRRYAPDGALLQHVALPCARVTKLAFGGHDLATAYVTTARTGLTPAELAEQPLAGGLFAFDPPCPGQASHLVVL